MKYIKNTILLLILLFTFNSKGQTCDTTFKSFTNVTNPASNSTNKCKARYVTHKDNYPSTGKQTWYYEIYSGTPAVSHTVFGFPYCLTIKQMGKYNTYDSSTFTKYNTTSYSKDNSIKDTNIWGYKFDYGITSDSIAKYYITVDKIYETGTISLTIKGGNSHDTKSFCGPNMDCDALPITLLFYNIEENDGTDVITWITATELNIDNYEVSLITSNDTSNIDTVLTYVSYSQKVYTRTYKKPEITNYFYKINAINYNGETDKTFYLIPKSNTDKEQPINIFPNPTHNVLNIPNKIGKNITIYDLQGKIVYNDVVLFKETIIDIDPGVYIILCDNQYTKVIFY